MKKFTVLVALALLAATGTSYAVTCAQDNVPAATLLVPYFKVSRNGTVGNTTPIPEGGVDTLVAVTNVSEWGIVAHVTVWNKQSKAVLDFNIPMTGFDVAFFRMKDVLNGHLNINETQVLGAKNQLDPCVDPAFLGNDQGSFIRFRHPNTGNQAEFSVYLDPAFTGGFRDRVWHSLDEGFDYNDLRTSPGNDVDNPACGFAKKGELSGDFTGYLTIDVTNYCTQLFPAEPDFYIFDAIATQGWDGNGGPNVLMGDVFFIDPSTAGGNISGDNAVALEYDNRLDWTIDKTFYNRYETITTDTTVVDATRTWGAYMFIGDGREPLGTNYGFRYMNDSAQGLQTFITVWRSDIWGENTDLNLCGDTKTSVEDLNTVPISFRTWDNEENELVTQTVPNPSGGPPINTDTFVWWEAQRIAISGSQFTKDDFKGGWTNVTFNPQLDPIFAQAYVGVMHTGPGLAVSVGYSATLLDQDFTCPGSIVTTPGIGNIDFGTVTP